MISNIPDSNKKRCMNAVEKDVAEKENDKEDLGVIINSIIDGEVVGFLNCNKDCHEYLKNTNEDQLNECFKVYGNMSPVRMVSCCKRGDCMIDYMKMNTKSVDKVLKTAIKKLSEFSNTDCFNEIQNARNA